MPTLNLIALLIFLTVFLGVTATLLYLGRAPHRLEGRLRAVRTGSEGTSPTGDRSARALFVIDPASYTSLRARLVQAGLRGPHAEWWFNFARIVVVILSMVAAYYVAGLLMVSPATRALMLALAAGSGWGSVWLWLNGRVNGKRLAIREAIPNVLDLIIVCVEAGLGLNAAVQRISKEMKQTYPDLSRELAILNEEIFLGKSRGEAFRDLARRTGVDELRSLATVLMQSDRMGTSIADVLRVQAQNIRTRRRQKALEATHKMPVKLVFPLVLLIFPELMVVLLGPAGIHLLRTLTETAAGR